MENYTKTKLAKSLLDTILNAPKFHFNDLTPSKIPTNLSGVYVISQISNNEALYVGRSINLRRRIYQNHLHGNLATARLKKYLINDQTVNDINEAKFWIQQNCYFQFIEIKDSRERGMTEGLYSFFYDVKYIEREH